MKTSRAKEISPCNSVDPTGSFVPLTNEQWQSIFALLWFDHPSSIKRMIPILENRLSNCPQASFQENIYIMFEYFIFPQIHSENAKILDNVAEFCSIFSNVEFGKGKDFIREMKQVCLKHFDYKNQSIIELKSIFESTSNVTLFRIERQGIFFYFVFTGKGQV